MAWQDEMKAAVVRYLVAKGTPVDNRADGDLYYGWIADDVEELRAHMAGCTPDMGKCSFTDVRWTEFDGTFSDDRDKAGVEATITCVCGEIAGRKWRSENNYADLINSVTSGEYG